MRTARSLKINAVVLFCEHFLAKPLNILQENEDELESILNAAINRG